MIEDMAGNKYVMTVTTHSSSPMTMRMQVEYLYGPPGVLFDVQPRYSTAEAFAYAKKMGLPTRFPL